MFANKNDSQRCIWSAIDKSVSIDLAYINVVSNSEVFNALAWMSLDFCFHQISQLIEDPSFAPYLSFYCHRSNPLLK